MGTQIRPEKLEPGKSDARRLAFTKRRLEALAVPERGRVYHNDATTAGLCLCVTERGTRTFYLTKNVRGQVERSAWDAFPTS